MKSKKLWKAIAMLSLSFLVFNGCSTTNEDPSSSSLSSASNSSTNLSSESTTSKDSSTSESTTSKDSSTSTGSDTTTSQSSPSITPVAEHTVTFDANEGKFANDESTFVLKVEENTVIGANKVTNPSRDNYGFANWTKTKNGNDIWNLDVDVVTNDITLYASWTANKYHVTINNTNNDAGTVTGAGDYSYGTNVTVTATANPGYEFAGWYIDPDGEAVESNSQYSFALLKATTLTAKWNAKEYQITLNVGEGATQLENTKATVKYKENYTLAVPTKTGYGFDGWYYNNEKLTDNTGASINPYSYTTDIEVEAHYTDNTYTVSTVISNIPGQDAIIKHITFKGVGTYHYGDKVTLEGVSDLSIIKVAGWRLNGKYTEGTKLEFTITESVVVEVGINADSPRLHYMVDEKEYKVGSYVLSKDATNEILDKYDDFWLRINKKFDGWYEDAEYTKPCNATPQTYLLPLVKKDDGSYHAYVYGRIVDVTIEKVFQYTENTDNTITITAYVGSESDVVIPNTYDGKTVSAIGKRAFDNKSRSGDPYFWDNDKIKSVFIPNTVKTIGEDAFRNCKNLETVTFEENSTLTEIGVHAFQTCDSLVNITLPSSLRTIKQKAFSYLVSLHYMYVPSTVTTMEDGAFDGVMVYTDAKTHPTGWVKGSGFYEYFVCYDVASPDLIYDIDGVQYVYRDTYFEIAKFKNRNLEHLTIPDKIQLKDKSKEVEVTTIKAHVFEQNTTLKTIIIPATITNFGLSVFYQSTINIFTYYPDHSKDKTILYNATKGHVYIEGEWELVDGIPTPKNK